MMYFICFIAKVLIGSAAIAVYMDHPKSKNVGYISGIAFGITLSQYLAHYIW